MHRLLCLIFCGALVLPCMRAQEFVVSQRDQAVGTVVCRGPAQAVVKVEQQGLSYALSRQVEIGPAGHLRSFELNAVVNSEAVRVHGQRVAAGWRLETSARGHRSTNQLAGGADAVVLADFDAGALEALLHRAAKNNGRDLWAIVPRQTGSIEEIRLGTLPDENGTLDGKQLTVHHLSFTLAGARIELFASEANELLQAEYSDQGYAIVRRGFVLAPSAKPRAVE